MHFYEIKKDKGFSLIELTIVIGILGILSTIALPSLLTAIEKTSDRIVRTSLLQSFKECQIDIINDEEIPTFQLDMGTVRRNGYYKFYQQYDYIPRKDDVLKAEFNTQQKIKLSLELGEKFLNNKFIEKSIK